MHVTITGVEPHGPFDTVILFRGFAQDTNRLVHIGVDHRPAGNLLDQLAHGWDVEVDAEDWQVLA